MGRFCSKNFNETFRMAYWDILEWIKTLNSGIEVIWKITFFLPDTLFPGHHLALVGLEIVQYALDGVVGIPKVYFVEFFNVLFFDAVYDALYLNVGDHLLQVKLLLKFLGFFLESEYIEWGWCWHDAFIDVLRLSDWLGGGDIPLLGDARVVCIAKDNHEYDDETSVATVTTTTAVVRRCYSYGSGTGAHQLPPWRRQRWQWWHCHGWDEACWRRWWE